MGKAKFLILSILGLLLGVPGMSAQDMIGKVVEPEDLADGMEVVFEARSGKTSAGHYLHSGIHPPNLGATNSWNWARSNPSITDVADDIVWILEKAGEKNPITGMDQWYIKNRKTGKYLTFVWDWTGKSAGSTDDSDRWADTYSEDGTYFADTKEDAKAFCLVSNGDENWASQYGSLRVTNSGDWGGDTYAICYIFDPTGYTNTSDVYGGGYGRMWLADEYESAHFNIRWYSAYQDTNVWDIQEVVDRGKNPRKALEALLDNYSTSVLEEYLVGTDPGFVSEELYDKFIGIYDNATNNIASWSDDQCKAVLDELYAAKEALDAPDSKVKIEDGGYYYIKTAYDAFTTAGNGEFAWVAPFNSTLAGWKAFEENDNQFIWQIKEDPSYDPGDAFSTTATGNMYYTFRNVGSGYYLGNATSHGDGGEPAAFTTEPVRIKVTDLGSGQWNIGSKYDLVETFPPRAFGMGENLKGAGTQGRLILWSGGANTSMAWYIRKVPQEQVDGISDASRTSKDELRKAFFKYDGIATGAVVGTGIGMPHSQEVVDNVNNALAVAKGYSNGETAGTPGEMDAARTALENAVAAFNSQVSNVPDGYYRVRSNYTNFRKNDNDAYFALSGESAPGWRHYEKTTAQLWKITNVDGGYTIQNVKNGMYLDKAESSANGSLVGMTAQPQTVQTISSVRPDGQVSIGNEADRGFSYDPANHSNGAGEAGRLQLWNSVASNGGASWTLVPVSGEDAQALIAGEDENQLNLNLKAKFEEGRVLYNASANYSLGGAIVTSADQFYFNNWSPYQGDEWGYLIDGDKGTYFSTTLEDGQEQDPANAHYTRVYCADGFPDTVQVNYVKLQVGTMKLIPVKMRVQVSNDAESWTELYELKPGDISNNGQYDLSEAYADSLHYVVSGLKGYKYVRFVSQVNRKYQGGTVVTDNGHMRYAYAEFNLYPVTGLEAQSAVLRPALKGAAESLLAALREAMPQYVGGSATAATYGKLAAAVDAFKLMSGYDAALEKAKTLAESVAVGSGMGQVREQSTLDDLKSAIAAAGAALSSGGSSAAAKAAIEGALETFIGKITQPEPGKWYYILSATAGTDNSTEGYYPSRQVRGAALYVLGTGRGESEGDYSADNQLRWGMDDIKGKAREGDIDAIWRFVPAPDSLGRRVYYIQNLRTGWYVGTAQSMSDRYYAGSAQASYPFRVEPVGRGQFNITALSGISAGRRIFFGNNARQVHGEMYSGTYDNRASFTFEEFTDDEIYMSFDDNSARIVTLPFAVTELSQKNNNVRGYGIHSLVDSTGLGLVRKDDFAAGEPLVIVVGDTVNRSDGDGKVSVFFGTPADITTDAREANGLVGTFPGLTLPHIGYGYFAGSLLRATTGSVGISPHSGYVNPGLVRAAEGEPDVVLPLYGNGILNKIGKLTAVPNSGGPVDVYTIDGVPVRRGVSAGDAAKSLSKGVYIIGKKKVLVR